MAKNTKYIFVAGGVMSGVGKGITTASIGKILQARGFKVTAIKIDPYINVDAGTMNPMRHGEVFVTEDGDETDQDIGNYERFLDIDILRDNYMTTGRIYQTVIQKERNLEYGGRDVEVVPDIPNEVIRRIKLASQKADADFCIVEIGGTVGEYQNIIFLEAARMMYIKDRESVAFVLVSYLPVPANLGEMKTKPTQHAIRTLNSAGIQPDFVVCRAPVPLDKPRMEKIANNCSVQPEHVVSAPDVESIYEVPVNFEKDRLSDKILERFGIANATTDLKEWRELVRTIKGVEKPARIVLVGKYFASGNFVLADAYISVIEAIKHACWGNKLKPELVWVNSEKLEQDDKESWDEVRSAHGIVIPQGWGTRGSEGKIKAIRFARENKVPYLGLCYGMQMGVVEFARNACGLQGAHSLEADKDTPHPVIHVMPDQEKYLAERQYGGTIRLGGWPCKLKPGTVSAEAYGELEISERHRHRYEFNNEYRDKLESRGLVIAGTSPDDELVEIIELKDHPFFVGVQFHPEYKSRPLKSHPLFKSFIKACVDNQK